jgi:hypothetical protein
VGHVGNSCLTNKPERMVPMKKTVAFLTSASALSLLLAPAAVASAATNHTPEVIYQKQEIKDLNQLMERAKKGISDAEAPNFKAVSQLVNKHTDEKLNAKTMQTSQLLKDVVFPDGLQEKDFTTTVFASGVIPNTSQQLSYDGTDSSISVSASSTFYWNEYTGSDGHTYMNMTSASGYWTQLDSSVFLSNPRYTLVQNGGTLAGGIGNQKQSYQASGLSFYQTPPSGWKAIDVGVTLGRNFGVNSWIDCTRHGSSWTFELIDTYDSRGTVG